MSNRLGEKLENADSAITNGIETVSDGMSNKIDKAKSWAEKIADRIKDLFSRKTRQPLKAVPVALLLCESMDRPGLSAIALTGAVIKRLSEAGIPTEPNADGTENVINRFVQIMAEEFVNEIKNNMKISVGIQSGTCFVVGTANGPAGPLPVTATNVTPISATGIAQ